MLSTGVFFFFFLFTISVHSPVNDASFVAPVSKDPTTLLYSLPVYLKTPPKSHQLHLDLGASFTWIIDCDNKNYTSTQHYISCGTPLCKSIPTTSCTIHNKCALSPENPVTRKSATSFAITDSLTVLETNGKIRTLPTNYVFSCSPTFLRKGLPKKSEGVAAFGRSNYSLPAQVSRAFSRPNYFALCLSSSTSAPGVAFLASSGPYYFRGTHQETDLDLSRSLLYTPLIQKGTDGKPSDEYFIQLTSIKVNGQMLQVNPKLFAIDNKTGFGGTKISTSTPYGILETSIHKALTDSIVNLRGAVLTPIAPPVKPFTLCYSAADVPVTELGPVMPMIDLVMHHKDVFWRLYGGNSMVRVKKNGVDAWCLGFLDGGVNSRTSVVIGGLQMEENLLQFDLESKRMGFSSSVLLRGTKCANFNFIKKK